MSLQQQALEKLVEENEEIEGLPHPLDVKYRAVKDCLKIKRTREIFQCLINNGMYHLAQKYITNESDDWLIQYLLHPKKNFTPNQLLYAAYGAINNNYPKIFEVLFPKLQLDQEKLNFLVGDLINPPPEIPNRHFVSWFFQFLVDHNLFDPHNLNVNTAIEISFKNENIESLKYLFLSNFDIDVNNHHLYLLINLSDNHSPEEIVELFNLMMERVLRIEQRNTILVNDYLSYFIYLTVWTLTPKSKKIIETITKKYHNSLKYVMPQIIRMVQESTIFSLKPRGNEIINYLRNLEREIEEPKTKPKSPKRESAAGPSADSSAGPSADSSASLSAAGSSQSEIIIDPVRLANSTTAKGYLLRELKEFCRYYHLPVSGTKAELVKRIQIHLKL